MPTFQPTPLSTMRWPSAEPVEDVERALRIADRARADRDRVVVVEHDDAHAALREIDRDARGRPVPAPTTTTGWRVPRAVLIGAAAVRVARVGVGLHVIADRLVRMRRAESVRLAHASQTYETAVTHVSPLACPRGRQSMRVDAITPPAPPTSPCRAARSRCADRGAASPRRTRARRRTAGNGRRSPSGRTAASAPRTSRGRRCAGPCPPPRPRFTDSNIAVTNARVPSSPACTCAGFMSAAPRPGTSFSGFSAAMLSSVAGQSVEVGIAGVRRRVELDQVAGEQDALVAAARRPCRPSCGRARAA